tara:strand:+ start:1529 stop:2482 length:954 start_codon:yes stop_codon:yes gene_type:complete
MDYFKVKTVDDISKLHNDAFQNASKSTKETFKQSLKRIEKIYNKPFTSISLHFVEQPKAFMTMLEESHYSDNTKLATVASILKFLKLIDAPLMIYNEWLSYLKDKTNEKHEVNDVVLKSKLKVLVDYKTIKHIVQEKASGFETAATDAMTMEEFRNFLIVSLFTLQIPVRVSNFVNMKVVDDIEFVDNNSNYLLLKDDSYKLIFNKYRTSHILGTKKINIVNPTIQFLIDKYLTVYNKDSTNFLIQSEKNKRPMNGRQIEESFTKSIESITGHQLSIDNLRASYMKHILELDPDFQDKLDIAQIMGYSTTSIMDKHF